MPCTYDGPYVSSQQTQDDLDRLTNMLCSLCDFLEKKHRILFYAICTKFSSLGLEEWWENHKKLDTEKKLREKLEAQRKQEIEDALSKLTPKERELLGL